MWSWKNVPHYTFGLYWPARIKIFSTWTLLMKPIFIANIKPGYFHPGNSDAGVLKI